MMSLPTAKQKVVVVGAGPVGSLAAIYAATRGDDVEVYELRGGKLFFLLRLLHHDLSIPCALDLYVKPVPFLRVGFPES